ncbi:MAG: helix-turn-helix transcriptional regulator [Rhodomicrobium sp.]
MSDRTLRIKAVTAMTGLSRAMIYKLMADGEFPPGFQAGSVRLVQESEVLEWMAAKARGEAPQYKPLARSGKPQAKYVRVPVDFLGSPSDAGIDGQLSAARKEMAAE